MADNFFLEVFLCGEGKSADGLPRCTLGLWDGCWRGSVSYSSYVMQIGSGVWAGGGNEQGRLQHTLNMPNLGCTKAR